MIFLKQMQNHVKQEAQDQLKKLSQQPLSQGEIIDDEMLESFSPALSPDKRKLAYVARNSILRRRLQVLVRASPNEPFNLKNRLQYFGKDWDVNLPSSPIPRRQQDDPPGGNITRVSWHPNSREYVFDQVLVKNRFEEISDLWIFHLATGKAQKITEDGRAREPSFSPDGFKIAYVKLDSMAAHLYVYDLRHKTQRQLFHSPLQTRVSFPSWLSADRIVFSVHQNGEEKAMVKTLSTGELVQILGGFKDPLYFDPQKDRVLFTSTQNGVRNLYQSNSDFSAIRPVSNSATGVVNAVYDDRSRRYIFTEVTDHGMQLKSLPEAAAVQVEELPKIDAFWQSRFPPRPYPGEASLSERRWQRRRVDAFAGGGPGLFALWLPVATLLAAVFAVG